MSLMTNKKYSQRPTGINKRRLVHDRCSENYDRTVYRRALMLPSAKCLCVIAGFESGIFDHTTRFTFYESDPVTADKARRTLRTKLGLFEGVHYEMHVTSIENTDPSDLQDDQKFDYVFLDFCGTCTAKISLWLLETSHRWMAKNARIAFTFCNVAKMTSRHWIRDSYQHLCNPVSAMISQDLLSGTHSGWVRNIYAHDYDVEGSRRIQTTAIECVYSQMSLLWCSLPKRFQVYYSAVYNDSATPMLFVTGHLTDEDVPKFFKEKLAYLFEDWYSRKKLLSGIRPVSMSPQRWARHPQNFRNPKADISALAYPYLADVSLLVGTRQGCQPRWVGRV